MGTDSDQIRVGLNASFRPLRDLFGPHWDLFGLAAALYSRLFSAFDILFSQGLLSGLAAAPNSRLFSAFPFNTSTHAQQLPIDQARRARFSLRAIASRAWSSASSTPSSEPMTSSSWESAAESAAADCFSGSGPAAAC